MTSPLFPFPPQQHATAEAAPEEDASVPESPVQRERPLQRVRRGAVSASVMNEEDVSSYERKASVPVRATQALMCQFMLMTGGLAVTALRTMSLLCDNVCDICHHLCLCCRSSPRTTRPLRPCRRPSNATSCSAISRMTKRVRYLTPCSSWSTRPARWSSSRATRGTTSTCWTLGRLM